MRIAVVDHYYPDFLSGWEVRPERGYAAELQRLLEFCFGTFDAYSRGLRAQGHEAIDIVANATALQTLWARENGFGSASPKAIVLQQIEEFRPDVVFLQSLSWFSPIELESLGKRYLLAGQCSCPMPAAANVKQFDVIFTSFPHYVERFEALGVRAVFNPLAFDPIVLERMGPISGERSGCVFVGGVGSTSHWKYGTEVLETVAREIGDAFSWFGYGLQNLSADSPLRKCYRGPAWGLDMYRVMSKSHIVINRHGEVAEGFANNMRLFECSGVGAMLLTESKSNLSDYFTDREAVTYKSSGDAVEKIRYFLKNPRFCRDVAAAGWNRTLRDHTYSARMETIANALQEQLAAV